MVTSNCRRLSIFTSVLMFTAAVALVVVSLVTEYWFECKPTNDNGATNVYNYIHSGLFKGSRQLDMGLGPRFKTFTVYEEVHEEVSFFAKIPWIFILFFIALGLLWNVIGVIVSIVNTVVKEKNTIAGPVGIYFWSTLALISYGSAIIIFLIEYATSIKQNVLLKSQVEKGFSSANQTYVSFSFYLMVAAIVSLLIPNALMFLTAERKANRYADKGFSIDNTAFMY